MTNELRAEMCFQFDFGRTLELHVRNGGKVRFSDGGKDKVCLLACWLSSDCRTFPISLLRCSPHTPDDSRLLGHRYFSLTLQAELGSGTSSENDVDP